LLIIVTVTDSEYKIVWVRLMTGEEGRKEGGGKGINEEE
jgi:hypothetical protein